MRIYRLLRNIYIYDTIISNFKKITRRNIKYRTRELLNYIHHPNVYFFVLFVNYHSMNGMDNIKYIKTYVINNILYIRLLYSGTNDTNIILFLNEPNISTDTMVYKGSL